MALVSSAYEIYLPRPPVALQKPLFAVLVPVGKLMGYRASYPEYSGEDALGTDGSGEGRSRAAVIVAVAVASVLATLLVRRRASQR